MHRDLLYICLDKLYVYGLIKALHPDLDSITDYSIAVERVNQDT